MNGWEKGNCQDSPNLSWCQLGWDFLFWNYFWVFFGECCIDGSVILHNYDSANLIEEGHPEYCYFRTWTKFWFQLILVIAKAPRYDFDEKLTCFQWGQRVFLAVAMRGKALSHVGMSGLLFLTIQLTTSGRSEWLLFLGKGHGFGWKRGWWGREPIHLCSLMSSCQVRHGGYFCMWITTSCTLLFILLLLLFYCCFQ